VTARGGSWTDGEWKEFPGAMKKIILFVFLACPIGLTAQFQNSGIRMESGDFVEKRLPDKPAFREAMAELDYPEGVVPKIVEIDMNGDGHPECWIQGPPDACGTGGCPCIIMDGKTGRRIGSVFGSPFFVSDLKINGCAVIHAYAHAGAGSGTVSVWVFDGKAYVLVSRIDLEGASVDKLFSGFNRFRRLNRETP